MNNIAWLMATSPEAKLRDGKEAVAVATKALRLAGGNDPAILDTVAAATVGVDLPNITNLIWSGAALVIAGESNCRKTQSTGRLSCLVAAHSPRQV